LRWAGRTGELLIYPDSKSITADDAHRDDRPDENCEDGEDQKLLPTGTPDRINGFGSPA
jgi:hypothetical protein